MLAPRLSLCNPPSSTHCSVNTPPSQNAPQTTLLKAALSLPILLFFILSWLSLDFSEPFLL